MNFFNSRIIFVCGSVGLIGSQNQIEEKSGRFQGSAVRTQCVVQRRRAQMVSCQCMAVTMANAHLDPSARAPSAVRCPIVPIPRLRSFLALESDSLLVRWATRYVLRFEIWFSEKSSFLC